MLTMPIEAVERLESHHPCLSRGILDPRLAVIQGKDPEDYGTSEMSAARPGNRCHVRTHNPSKPPVYIPNISSQNLQRPKQLGHDTLLRVTKLIGQQALLQQAPLNRVVRSAVTHIVFTSERSASP